MKKSIYRDSGTVTWASSVKRIKEAISGAQLSESLVVIKAPLPGCGKSTALEVLSKQAKGFVVEGDIMTTLGYILSDIPGQVTDDMILSDIAKGLAIKDYDPWKRMKADDQKNAKIREGLLTIDKQFYSKIALCTSFSGAEEHCTAMIAIVPDYAFYKKNLMARSKQMIKDGWDESHLIKHHHLKEPASFFQTMTDDFIDVVCSYPFPVFFVPNYSMHTFPLALIKAYEACSQYNTSPEGRKVHSDLRQPLKGTKISGKQKEKVEQNLEEDALKDEKVPHTTDEQREDLSTWLRSEVDEFHAAKPGTDDRVMELIDCVPSTDKFSLEQTVQAYKKMYLTDPRVQGVLIVWDSVVNGEGTLIDRVKRVYESSYTEKMKKKNRTVIPWQDYVSKVRGLLSKLDVTRS